MDELMLRAYKKGDESAFEKLYDENAANALRLARIITKNDAMASDAVQEAFIRAYLYRKSYKPQKPFCVWFSRIVVNECRRLMSSGMRYTASFELVQQHIEKGSVQPGEYDSLYEAIEQLPEILRTALLLKYIHGFSEKDIADTLDLSASAVKSRLYQARQKLKEQLS